MNTHKFFKVGSDPEAFIRDKQGNLVSAIGIIPGNKVQPHITTHGSIQHDNILAEFNSKPSSDLQEFILNHRLIIGDLESVLKPLDLKLDFIASALADESLLSDPIARLAGCDPDFNAWDMSINSPADYESSNIRAAGGHLHISYDQAVGNFSNKIKMVKALDFMLGVPSVIFDKDDQRRTLYGKAGAHRPKDTQNTIPDPYDGVEYRTLSNFWLKSDEMMAFVFNGVKTCYENLEDLAEQAEFYRDDIIRIINTGNRKEATDFCKEVGIYVG